MSRHRSKLQLRQALEGLQVEDTIPSDVRGMGKKDPSRFRLHPYHLTVGLNILMHVSCMKFKT